MADGKKKQAKVGPFMSAVIGGITGALEISITYPTEYTKTVMQLYPEVNKKGAIACAKDTVAQRGFLGLYRGYSALLFFSIPKNYCRFGAYTVMKEGPLKENTKLNNFCAGLAAGACESTFVVTPMETVKVKLIHDKFSDAPKYRNLFHGIYTIIQN